MTSSLDDDDNSEEYFSCEEEDAAVREEDGNEFLDNDMGHDAYRYEPDAPVEAPQQQPANHHRQNRVGMPLNDW